MPKISKTLDLKIYNLEIILGACYAFIDRAYVFLKMQDAKKVRISFSSKGISGKQGFKQLAGEFDNQLLQCALRYKISRNNKKIREYIVGRALHSVLPASANDRCSINGLQAKADPLGIAIPWEKKYAKKTCEKPRVRS